MSTQQLIERPILFSAPMVRAILAGTKTQTRRLAYVLTKNASRARFDRRFPPSYGNGQGPTVGHAWTLSRWHDVRPGDRLWVRETWMADPPITGDWPSTQFHGCKPRDHSLIPERFKAPAHCLYRADGHADIRGWTPAIHMYRWASRITLDVTGVRVERLQDISDEDARAEGAEPRQPATASGIYISGQYRLGFRDLWDQINGPGSWDANPWVWVVEFRSQP